MRRTGVRLLWGTANLFGIPATPPAPPPTRPEVFAYAAAQVKKRHRRHYRLGGVNLRAVGRPGRL